MSYIDYIVFYLEFVFQNYCIYVYASALFTKVRKWWVTASLLVLISILEFGVYFSDNVVLNLALFMLMTFIIMKADFEVSVTQSIVHSFILTVLLSLSEMIVSPITNLMVNTSHFQSDNYRELIYISTVSKLLLFVMCRLIAKKAQNEDKFTNGLLLFTIPATSLLVLIYTLYYLNVKGGFKGFDNVLISLSSAVLLAANIVVFVVYENYASLSKELNSRSLYEQKRELDYNYYNILQKNYDDSRIMIHDFKHHLDVLKSMVVSGSIDDISDYIDLVQQDRTFSGRRYITGNKILDIVIYQKQEECRLKGIKFTFRHNNINFSYIDDTDLCSITSNILDNAIESAEKASDKFVNLEFYQNSSLYFIEVNNSCVTKPTENSKGLITSKKNKEYHGVGMSSVKRAVRKYNGDVSYKYIESKSVFRVTISIKKPNNTRAED